MTRDAAPVTPAAVPCGPTDRRPSALEAILKLQDAAQRGPRLSPVCREPKFTKTFVLPPVHKKLLTLHQMTRIFATVTGTAGGE